MWVWPLSTSLALIELRYYGGYAKRVASLCLTQMDLNLNEHMTILLVTIQRM